MRHTHGISSLLPMLSFVVACTGSTELGGGPEDGGQSGSKAVGAGGSTTDSGAPGHGGATAAGAGGASGSIGVGGAGGVGVGGTTSVGGSGGVGGSGPTCVPTTPGTVTLSGADESVEYWAGLGHTSTMVYWIRRVGSVSEVLRASKVGGTPEVVYPTSSSWTVIDRMDTMEDRVFLYTYDSSGQFVLEAEGSETPAVTKGIPSEDSEDLDRTVGSAGIYTLYEGHAASKGHVTRWNFGGSLHDEVYATAVDEYFGMPAVDIASNGQDVLLGIANGFPLSPPDGGYVAAVRVIDGPHRGSKILTMPEKTILAFCSDSTTAFAATFSIPSGADTLTSYPTGIYAEPLGGGAPTLLVADNHGEVIAVDDTYLYYGGSGAPCGSLMRVPKVGGTPEMVADVLPTAMSLDGSMIWISTYRGAIMGIPKP